MNFLYCRVSTAEQAEKGWSLEGQEQELRTICNAGSISVYTDIATGSNTRRPGLQQMLAAASACGEGGTLYVWRPDRLSRCQPDFWRIFKRLERAGFDLHFYNPNQSMSDPNGRMVISIMLAVAEFELSTLKIRTKMGLETARARGVHTGSPGFGFEIQDGKLHLSNADRKGLRIIHSLRRQGHSYRSIANALNEEGIPRKKKGCQWWASTVRSIVQTSNDVVETIDQLLKGDQ